MNETAPAQKQDIDGVKAILRAILAELRALRQHLGSDAPVVK